MKLFRMPLFWLCLVLFGIISYLLINQYSLKNNNVAVYLTTGELYFGQKTGLWGFKLKNAWLMNKGEDAKYSLQEFSQAVWKPAGLMNISKDKVVFWTNLDENSDVGKLIKGEKKAADIPPASSLPTVDSSDSTKK